MGATDTFKREKFKMHGDSNVIAILGLVMFTLVGTQSAQADVYPDPIATGRDGFNDGLYMIIRDSSEPAPSQLKINALVAQGLQVREWLAVNSGGKADMYYDQVVDVPVPKVGGAAPGNWPDQAKQYVRDTYNVEPDNYYARAYNVNGLSINKPWAGVCCNNNGYSLNYENLATHTHEFGHYLGAAHARTYTRPTSGTYVWDDGLQQYRTYGGDNSADFTPLPFGSQRNEYGSSFDVMGSGPQDGHLRMRKKRDFAWLQDGTQVPSLNDSGAGTYRIYAHDELVLATENGANLPQYNDTLDHYGVVDTYDASKVYGLSLTRTGEVFNTATGQFDPETQIIDIEYRSGHDGLLFSVNDVQLVVNASFGSNSSRQGLEFGQSLLDSDLGHSRFIGTDFLSYHPPAPTDPLVYNNSWFEFTVTGLGSDSTGSYLEVLVTEMDDLNGMVGDVTQDGFINSADTAAFIAGWRTDTSALVSVEKYKKGDLDRNGITNLADALIMHDVLGSQGNAFLAALMGTPVPEPTSASLLALALLALSGVARRRP